MRTVIIITIIFQAYYGHAQNENENFNQQMQDLSFMVGSWKGTGWIINQGGVKSEFNQNEEIYYDLNGSVLVARGTGKNTDGKVIHDALGIISYQLQTNEYKMNAFLANGMKTEASLEIIGDGKLKWWFETGNGSTIRYTSNIKDGIWTEKGEYSPDNEAWYPFMQFSLSMK
ncbi:MAG: hypothetical protein O2887_03400 [Bacteroidetes bacterium]|nr:hypothetical protein [Bacteroidota bacterium]MDA1119531.1 hypothetical protein [Bacteroidota bacterium]